MPDPQTDRIAAQAAALVALLQAVPTPVLRVIIGEDGNRVDLAADISAYIHEARVTHGVAHITLTPAYRFDGAMPGFGQPHKSVHRVTITAGPLTVTAYATFSYAEPPGE